MKPPKGGGVRNLLREIEMLLCADFEYVRRRTEGVFNLLNFGSYIIDKDKFKSIVYLFFPLIQLQLIIKSI